MSTNFGLIKLISSDGVMNANFPFYCAEELCNYQKQSIEDTYIKIYCNNDAIREIFITIKLPALNNNLIWKDNLLEHLINEIKISLDYYYFAIKQEINLSKNYILNNINSLKNYSDRLLFKNLSSEQRKKMSQRETEIIFPLKVANFIKNPNEILTTGGDFFINLDFNKKELVEGPNDYILNNLNFEINVIGVFYEGDYRHNLHKNLETHLQNQKILKNI